MSLGLPPNVIDSITFRGSVHFYYTYRRLHYHTSVAICRLIARTVLILDSSAIDRLVIRVQRGSGGGAAAAPSCTRGNQLISVWFLCVIVIRAYRLLVVKKNYLG